MNHSRRGLTVVVAVALAVGSATAVEAASRHRANQQQKGTSTQSGVDHQKVAWRIGSGNVVATRSTSWQPLPLNNGECRVGIQCEATNPILVQSNGDIALSFSGNFTRAPVEIRVKDAEKVMRPGVAKFEPTARGQSFSYTFIGLAKSGKCRGIQLEWRSPTGNETRMTRAAVVVDYKGTKPPSRGECG